MGQILLGIGLAIFSLGNSSYITSVLTSEGIGDLVFANLMVNIK